MRWHLADPGLLLHHQPEHFMVDLLFKYFTINVWIVQQDGKLKRCKKYYLLLLLSLASVKTAKIGCI